MTTSIGSAPAIEIAALTKRFGRTVAVNDLSLTIPRGSTFGLLGPNGAGKSTTIKMLMGMLSPTGGEVRVLGIDVREDPVQVKQRVGYVPETHYIYRWMRVGRSSASADRATSRGTMNLPGDARTVCPRSGEKSQASLEGDAHETCLVAGRFARAGTAAVGRTALGPGPDRARGISRRRAADDLQSRANRVDLQPHARRRAAIGRHGGDSLRGAIDRCKGISTNC